MEEQKIEAVIVCFGFLDLAKITIPLNLPYLDHLIILTKEKDEIIDYCNSLNIDKITVVVTDAFTFNNSIFDKGLVINCGLQCLKHKQFVITMDIDVVLPVNFRKKFLESANNIEYIYGARRYLVETKKDWNDFLNNSYKPLLLRGFGYGFFTAFHYESSTFQRLLKTKGYCPYPCFTKVANEIDWQFVRNWNNASMVYNPPLSKFPDCHYEKHEDSTVGLLKELNLNVCHLGPVGLNHSIRTTNKFE